MSSSTADLSFSSPAALIGVGIATLLFVVALVALFVLRRGGRGKRTVLLVGLSDAGKTLMYSRLLTGERVDTYTSMTENVCADVIVDDQGATAPLTLVDVPGEDRVRKTALPNWLDSTTNHVIGVVCVIDSVTFAKQARDVAELVYDLLVSLPRGAPVLFACNKQDSVQAKSANLVKSTLAKELSLLQKSRAASLQMTSGGGGNSRSLTTSGDEFDWETDAPKATFVEVQCHQQASDAADYNSEDDDEATEGDDCVARVRSWIAQLK